MICPICGFDMKEELTCEKCGFVVQEHIDEDASTDFDALEKIEVDFNELENSEVIAEDEVLADESDLEVDFETIEQNSVDVKSKKSNNWGSSIVSFIAGVLATLIVVGCLNGTIINYFDKITNGTPYETIDTFCDYYFFDNPSVDDMVKTFSSYYRSQVVDELAQYGFQNDVDLYFDMNDDEKFKDVANFYLNLINDTSSQSVKIKSINYDYITYYKSGSEQFESYLKKYKLVDNEANGVALFADVVFTINIDVTKVEQETVVPEISTKKNKKVNETDTTTAQTTTQTPKTTTENRIHKCYAVCVKVNNEWKIFSIQVLG